MKDKWFKGTVSYYDVEAFTAEDGEILYRFANPIIGETIEADDPFDLVTMLTSVGWDVTDVSDEYDIIPVDADVDHYGIAISGKKYMELMRKDKTISTWTEDAISLKLRLKMEALGMPV